MKVLGIVCSPRKGGNTEIMMEAALGGARSSGAETELWTVAGKDINPCDGCNTCRKKGGDGECHIKDDVHGLQQKMLAADGLIFGSPSYIWSVTAQAKIIIDRMHSLLTHHLLANKVAGVISVATARGHEGVWQQFHTIISLCHMLPADYAAGYAREKGEIRKDTFAMESAEELGKEIVSLIKQDFRWPEEYRRPVHHIMRNKYAGYNLPRINRKQIK